MIPQSVSFKNQKIIQSTNGKKIGQLPDDEPIKQVLRYVFALIGLKAENLPSDIQKVVLIDFIKTELSNYTVEEIKTAFQLAVKGEISVEINHFQNFSALYLSQVLKAYQIEKNAAILEFNKAEQRQKKENEMTPDEIERIYRDFDNNCLLDVWNEFVLTGNVNFSFYPPFLFYESLAGRHKVMKISELDKYRILDIAKKEIVKEYSTPRNFGSFPEFKRAREIFEKEGFKKDKLKQKCSEIAVTEFFKKCRNESIDLITLIKTKTNE